MLKQRKIQAWLIQTFNAFPEVEIGGDDGVTIIIRDRAQDDKVVRIIEPLNTVDLTYNPANDNRLAFTETIYPDYGGVEISQITKLSYSDYLNSKNNIENVVTGVEQRTWVKKKNNKNINIIVEDDEANEKYTKLLNELEELKESST